MSKKTIQNYISHLNFEDKNLILSNQDMINDILEQDLDEEEIDSLISNAKFVQEQNERQQITIKIPKHTLNLLKIMAKKE